MAEGLIFVLWVLGGWSTYEGCVACGALEARVSTAITTIVLWPLGVVIGLVSRPDV